jgi:hypothetical protein
MWRIKDVRDRGIDWAETAHLVHDNLIRAQRNERCGTEGSVRNKYGKVLSVLPN